MVFLSILIAASFLGRFEGKGCGCKKTEHSHHIGAHVVSPLPYTYIPLSSLPGAFDWRNVDGVNYLTQDLNQHIAQYCGACWLHGSISSLNDRLKIARKGQFPETVLARQVVLNCGNDSAGSCDGGTDYGVYVFASKYGIPDDTCQLYSAEEHTCSAFRNCMNCDPPTQDSPHGVCYPVQSYGRYFVREYQRMVKPSVHEMKAEIWKRGPISCSIDASVLEMGRYKAGAIVNETRAHNSEWDVDHVVSVAGWGIDPVGNEYWIVRNSWGTYWGDNGWFKVKIGINSIAIESDCSWATIDPEPVRKNWGPSDVNHLFASSVVPPRNGQDEKNIHYFNFVTGITDISDTRTSAHTSEASV